LGDVSLGDLKDAVSGMTAFMSGKGLSLESILSSGSRRPTDPGDNCETVVGESKEGTAIVETRIYSIDEGKQKCHPINPPLQRDDRPEKTSSVQSLKNSSMRRNMAQSEHTISSDLCPVDGAASTFHSSVLTKASSTSTALKSGTIRCREDYEILRDSKLAVKRAKTVQTA